MMGLNFHKWINWHGIYPFVFEKLLGLTFVKFYFSTFGEELGFIQILITGKWIFTLTLSIILLVILFYQIWDLCLSELRASFYEGKLGEVKFGGAGRWLLWGVVLILNQATLGNILITRVLLPSFLDLNLMLFEFLNQLGIIRFLILKRYKVIWYLQFFHRELLGAIHVNY